MIAHTYSLLVGFYVLLTSGKLAALQGSNSPVSLATQTCCQGPRVILHDMAHKSGRPRRSRNQVPSAVKRCCQNTLPEGAHVGESPRLKLCRVWESPTATKPILRVPSSIVGRRLSVGRRKAALTAKSRTTFRKWSQAWTVQQYESQNAWPGRSQVLVV